MLRNDKTLLFTNILLDIVASYIRAFMIDLESFRNPILDQLLWANRFINVQKQGKENIMVLHN